MSISQIGAAPIQPPVKTPATSVASDQSQFKAGLAQAASAAQKSAVDVTTPVRGKVNLRA